MTNVIYFQPVNSPRRMASGDRSVAQILFFTGVRYQRWGEDGRAPLGRTQSARRKRQPAEVGSERKSQR
jgi:hypothetical protein